MTEAAQPFDAAALYKECVSRAANDGKSLMDELVETGRQQLQNRAGVELDSGERHYIQEAARGLIMHGPMLAERFPMTLMAAFSEAISSPKSKTPAPAAATGGVLRFDELELMDESQVQESIELARAQQIAQAAADQQLAELNGLICAVLGLKTVQPDRNPLRPEIYVTALRTVLKLPNTDNAIRVRWMQAMGGALGARLKPIYAELSGMLREAGVKPVGYMVTQTPQAGGGQGAGGPRSATGLAASSGGVAGGAGYPAGGGGYPGGGGGYPAGGGGYPAGAGGYAAAGGAGAAPGGRLYVVGGPGGIAGAPLPPGAVVGGMPVGRQYGQDALLTVDQLRRLLSGEFDSGVGGLPGDSMRDTLRAPLTGGPSSGRGGLPNAPSSGAGGGYGNPGGFTGGAGGGYGGGGPPLSLEGEEPPQPDFAHTVPAAFDALEEMRQTERVLKRLSSRRGAPIESGNEALDDLRKNARGVGQALGLEVVNLMFENIAQEPHLLPPVQMVIRRVEPAYLRLVLIDPRFFSDKEHVARRLLDRMTERSLAYATVVTPGFDAFLKSLREAAEVLAISQIRDTDPFEYMLSTLEADWKRLDQRESRQRDKAVHALLHAEQRNLLAERLASELRGKPGAAMAPAEVMSFLTGPWSQVLAEARLTDRKGSPDPHGFMQVAHDLLWTTQPEQSRSNIERINGMIADLLERLRAGLERIEYPQSNIDAFGVVLMAVYDQILQGGGVDGPRLGRDSVSFGNSQQPSDTNDPWLAPNEVQDSNFLDISEVLSTHGGEFKHTETLFESTSPQMLESESEKRASERAKPPIPPGAWVELTLHDQVLRAQLTWSSPYGTLFMFTDSAGTTHSLTRRALDKLLARGSVTVISQGVVNEALDAVAQKALRNSIDVKL